MDWKQRIPLWCMFRFTKTTLERSISAGRDNSTTVHHSEQVLYSQDDVVLWRNLETWSHIKEDWHHAAVRRPVYQMIAQRDNTSERNWWDGDCIRFHQVSRGSVNIAQVCVTIILVILYLHIHRGHVLKGLSWTSGYQKEKYIYSPQVFHWW